MTASADAVERVERAVRARVGARAEEVMSRRSRHLAGMTPREMAQVAHGDRIVFAELHKIIRVAVTSADRDAAGDAWKSAA